MRLILFILLLLIPVLSYNQEIQKSDTSIIFVYDLTDMKTFYSKVDISPWETLKDSGAYNAFGLKDGLWVEYPIDSSLLFSNYNIRNDSNRSDVLKPDIIKEIGSYSLGRREGIWTVYTYNKVFRGNERTWELYKTIEYKNDVKEGKEIMYFPWGEPMTIITNLRNTPIGLTSYFPGGRIQKVIKSRGKKAITISFDEKGKRIDKEINK
jgi:antitoxin component YwqK of YwqJK toxin-antitoxin module